MIYQMTIHTLDSKKGITRDFDLDISPGEISKLKAFCTTYYGLTGGYAKITMVKAVLMDDDKPPLESSVYSDVTVMYTTNFGTIQNVRLPYIKKTKGPNDIKAIMIGYFQGFKGIINTLYKKVI